MTDYRPTIPVDIARRLAAKIRNRAMPKTLHQAIQQQLNDESAELTRLRTRVKALEAALKLADGAMCKATFDLRGKQCGDLNYAIAKARAAIAEGDK